MISRAAAAVKSAERGSGIRRGRYRSACRLKSNSDGSLTKRVAPDFSSPEPAAHVIELALDRQRGRRQHRRLHAVEQNVAQDVRHVDRRGTKENSATSRFQEVHVFAFVRAKDESQLVTQLGGPLGQARQIEFWSLRAASLDLAEAA